MQKQIVDTYMKVFNSDGTEFDEDAIDEDMDVADLMAALVPVCDGYEELIVYNELEDDDDYEAPETYSEKQLKWNSVVKYIPDLKSSSGYQIVSTDRALKPFDINVLLNENLTYKGFKCRAVFSRQGVLEFPKHYYFAGVNVKDCPDSGLITSVREKMDGTPVYFFTLVAPRGLDLYKGAVIYENGVWEIRETNYFYFGNSELCDNILYVSEGTYSEIEIGDKTYEVRLVEELPLNTSTAKKMMSFSEGAIFQVDGMDCRLKKVPTLDLSARKGTLFTKEGYAVANLDVPDGIVEVTLDYKHVRPRPDKVTADSQLKIEKLHSLVKYESIVQQISTCRSTTVAYPDIVPAALVHAVGGPIDVSFFNLNGYSCSQEYVVNSQYLKLHYKKMCKAHKTKELEEEYVSIPDRIGNYTSNGQLRFKSYVQSLITQGYGFSHQRLVRALQNSGYLFHYKYVFVRKRYELHYRDSSPIFKLYTSKIPRYWVPPAYYVHRAYDFVSVLSTNRPKQYPSISHHLRMGHWERYRELLIKVCRKELERQATQSLIIKKAEQ